MPAKKATVAELERKLRAQKAATRNAQREADELKSQPDAWSGALGASLSIFGVMFIIAAFRWHWWTIFGRGIRSIWNAYYVVGNTVAPALVAILLLVATIMFIDWLNWVIRKRGGS